MLLEQTFIQLRELHLTGMAAALEEQQAVPDVQALAFEDRLALLLEREATLREDRRLTRLLRQAKLRLPATIEDLDSALRGAWIAPSLGWPARTGSVAIRSFSSQVRPVPVRLTWRALWLRPPAAMAYPAATSASPGSSRTWPSPALMAPIPS